MNNALTNKCNEKWLNEVSFMRPILLIMLLVYHSFAPYSGAWTKPEAIQDVTIYKWIDLAAYSFLLEGFIFISGYVFTYQLIGNHHFESFKELAVNKFRRLIIPSLFFSFLYYLLFENYTSTFTAIISIMGGVAHLWYLPCLFWCFLLQYIIFHYKVSHKIVLLCLFFLAFFQFLPLPFQISKTMYYMQFFYGGGVFWKYKDFFTRYTIGRNYVTINFFLLFLIVFVVLNLLMEEIKFFADIEDLYVKAILLGCNNLLKAIIGWNGIAFIYIFGILFCRKYELNVLFVKMGTYAYAIYVIHQFILIYLYRYTSLSSELGSYWLPWAGIFITAIVSFTIASIIRSTRIGRKYL